MTACIGRERTANVRLASSKKNTLIREKGAAFKNVQHVKSYLHTC